MKIDKLIHEFANLKIENASKVLGGEQSGAGTTIVTWTKTNGKDPHPEAFTMDKHEYPDPELPYIPPIDTIPSPGDTIPSN